MANLILYPKMPNLICPVLCNPEIKLNELTENAMKLVISACTLTQSFVLKFLVFVLCEQSSICTVNSLTFALVMIVNCSRQDEGLCHCRHHQVRCVGAGGVGGGGDEGAGRYGLHRDGELIIFPDSTILVSYSGAAGWQCLSYHP